jgi:hypothetical protein
VTRLSEHFDTAEFQDHGGARMPQAYRAQLHELVTLYLEPMRRRWGRARVHSSYRSAVRNAEVGGAPHSFHTYERGRRGVAADVSFARGTPREWYAHAQALGVPGAGLYDDHVHLDTRRGTARW